MLKMTVAMRHRLWTVLLASMSIAIVAFIYADNWRTRQVLNFPVVNRDIAAGEILKKEDLKWIQIGGYHLEQLNFALTSDQVEGHYAKLPMGKGDALKLKDLLDEKPAIQLKEKLKSGALTIATDFERCVGGVPRPGDWVSLKIVLKDSLGTGVLEDHLLDRIKVITLQDKSGRPYAGKDNGIGSEPAYVTFDVNHSQQDLILKGIYLGKLHLVLLPQNQ